MIKRRTFPPALKARVVLEDLTGVKSAAEICREHPLKPQLLSQWKTRLLTRAADLFAMDSRPSEAQDRIAELERLVGRLTLELAVAKKASQLFSSRWPRNGR